MRPLLILLLIFIGVQPIWANGNSLAFLDKGMGPSSAAMGFAQTATVTDGNSVYINPARLAYTDSLQLQLSNFTQFETEFNALELSIPLGILKLGLGSISASSEGLLESKYNSSGRVELTGQDFKYKTSGMFIGGSIPLIIPNLYMGGSL